MPSQLLRLADEWTAYQFDNAVHLLGVVIENALQETTNTGSDKAPKYEQRYHLGQLLADDFRLPPPPKPAAKAQGLAGLMALAGKRGSGVKMLKAKG
jgi:hypothetical protein